MKYIEVQKKKKAKPTGKINYKILLFVVLMIAFVAVITLKFGKEVKAIFDPISIVSTVTGSDLKQTDGRINVLLLGLDKRDSGPVTSILTDTIMVASIGKVDGSIVLISVPRDLWIKDYATKINSIYAYYGVDTKENSQKGLTGLKTAVENVLGLPIHYYAMVDFDIFEQTVDTLGGITVNVDNSFEDYEYPIYGKENDPVMSNRYETIRFTKGDTVMDGVTALKFVRSRHGNSGEGTDFARAKRQQKVMIAIKDKAMSVGTLFNPTKLKGLYDTFSQNVETNVDFSTVQGFYLLSKQVKLDAIKSIVLDDRSGSENGGLLYAPTDTSLYKGAYVLIPRSGDFNQLHAYVQRYVFGSSQ